MGQPGYARERIHSTYAGTSDQSAQHPRCGYAPFILLGAPNFKLVRRRLHDEFSDSLFLCHWHCAVWHWQ
jgi:hypothetical protein